MSRSELVALCEKGTGLPVPDYDAPSEMWHQWIVATNIVLGCQAAESVEEGRALGISWLRASSMNQSKLEPYIRRIEDGISLSAYSSDHMVATNQATEIAHMLPPRIGGEKV